MPYFKDTTNKVYFFDDEEDADKYLPVGSVPITDAEVITLLPPPAQQGINPDAEIARISMEAVPKIIDWLSRNAVGADKVAMQDRIDEINKHEAKKKP